jgi:hypothetical protein
VRWVKRCSDVSRWVWGVERMLFEDEVVPVPACPSVFVVFAKVVFAHVGFKGVEDEWVMWLHLFIKALDEMWLVVLVQAN